jgi:hypothetical protein
VTNRIITPAGRARSGSVGKKVGSSTRCAGISRRLPVRRSSCSAPSAMSYAPGVARRDRRAPQRRTRRPAQHRDDRTLRPRLNGNMSCDHCAPPRLRSRPGRQSIRTWPGGGVARRRPAQAFIA